MKFRVTAEDQSCTLLSHVGRSRPRAHVPVNVLSPVGILKRHTIAIPMMRLALSAHSSRTRPVFAASG
jgi:hypothetical protein